MSERRTITTDEELDALPDGSVILDDLIEPLKRIGDMWYYGLDLRHPILPATVLWEPS